jgi:CRISPR/Cas system CMR subunit Cmr6 (Cas7 group RAMP superfamily)
MMAALETIRHKEEQETLRRKEEQETKRLEIQKESERQNRARLQHFSSTVASTYKCNLESVNKKITVRLHLLNFFYPSRLPSYDEFYEPPPNYRA